MKITLHPTQTKETPALPPEATPPTINTRRLEKLNKTRWIQNEEGIKIPLIKKKIHTPTLKLPRITFRTVEEEICEKTREELEKIRSENLNGLTPSEIQSPLLLLMRTNSDIDVFQNVPDGIFKIEKTTPGTKEKETETKAILLKNSKLLNLPYAGDNIKCWIAYEDEATPYPHNIQHDSSLIVKFYEKILLNMDILKEKGDQTFKWIEKILLIAAIVGIVAYLAWRMGVFELIRPKIITSNLTTNLPIQPVTTTIQPIQ